jgi:hypothetical protein
VAGEAATTPRALERDQREEHADAHRDRRSQRLRYALDEQLAQPRDRDDQEQAARDEDRAQRGLPRVAHAEHDHVGEVGVQAHARRHGDRVVGVQAHDQRAQRRDQAGGDEDRALGHARVAEDRGVDEDDVGHRQEGGEPRDDLGAHGGVVFVELEHLVDPVHGFLVSGMCCLVSRRAASF